jgi:hypothetical protein
MRLDLIAIAINFSYQALLSIHLKKHFIEQPEQKEYF